jgi:hypothetical protein
MLDFLLSIPAMLAFNRPQNTYETQVPMHVAAQNMMDDAMHLTVSQFNQACSSVCNAQKQP